MQYPITYHISSNKVRVKSNVPGIRLELITVQKGLDTLGRDNSFNGLVCEKGHLKQDERSHDSIWGAEGYELPSQEGTAVA